MSAATVLSAELRLRDGQSKAVRVQTGSGLAALITAVRELSHSVTYLLTELVLREQSQGARSAEADSEEEDEEDDEEDVSGPEPKRTKT